jgi:single-strand DNA-binding protein
MNVVVLIGRLVKRPELKKTQNNTSVVSFTLAVRNFVNGEEKADFIECVAWQNTADTISKHCDKGHQIGVSGRIGTRTYETSSGETRYVTEVTIERLVLLESKKVEKQDEFNDVVKGNEPKKSLATAEDLPF